MHLYEDTMLKVAKKFGPLSAKIVSNGGLVCKDFENQPSVKTSVPISCLLAVLFSIVLCLNRFNKDALWTLSNFAKVR